MADFCSFFCSHALALFHKINFKKLMQRFKSLKYFINFPTGNLIQVKEFPKNK
jgi:hypothetical protein